MPTGLFYSSHKALGVRLIGASRACRRGYATPIERDVLIGTPKCVAAKFQATPRVETGREREVARGEARKEELAGVSVE